MRGYLVNKLTIKSGGQYFIKKNYKVYKSTLTVLDYNNLIFKILFYVKLY